MVQNAYSGQVSARISSTILRQGAATRAPEFCFVSGSHLATIRGDIAVETLQVGDLVRTRSGAYSPVVELLRYRLAAKQVAATPDLSPVVIRRGAVAENLPKRDLLVTGGQVFESVHRLKLNHLVRSAPRTGATSAPAGCQDMVEFTVFRLRDRSAVRVERIWVESTPAAAHLVRNTARPLLAG